MKVNKVLAIAINDYNDPGLNKIENCYTDIGGIVEAINDKYVFDDIDFIYKKEETTRKALYAKLTDYFLNTLPEDNVLVLYAGHGEYNDKLGIAYWQPSDADPIDPSSWINISDVLAFIRAAKAYHISIISDSCFAGAIFEPSKRGGGIDALVSKKSREALTSGGIEKVSDGKKGEKSPFANTVIKVLMENEKSELPFTLFCNNVILQFDPLKKQTPMAGSLSEVGHDGGSFIFELKKPKSENINIDDKNEYLKSQMNNLFIPIQAETLDDIENHKKNKEEKNNVVRKQRFEEAAALRDIEKSIELKIKIDSEKYIDSFISDMKFTEEETSKANTMDEQIEVYNKEVEEQKARYEKEKLEYEKEKIEYEKAGKIGGRARPQLVVIGTSILPDISDFQFEMSYPDFSSFHFTKDNPATIFFNKNQQDLLEKYQNGIVILYKHYRHLQCVSTSPIIAEKLNSLRDILLKTYNYEIDLLMERNTGFLETNLQRKEIEIDLLKWLRNKE